MANTINLGSYPTGDGTTNEEKSLYIGNNQFVRVLTQSNPDRVIAVLSESTDVFSGTQTISNLHEQVLLNGERMLRFKLKQLPNGDVLMIGNKSTRIGSYVNTAISFRYNDVSGQFEVISDYAIHNNDASIYNMNEFGFEVYDNDSMVLFGVDSTDFSLFLIRGITSGTVTSAQLYQSAVPDVYFREQSTFTKVIDDKIFVSIGSEDNYQGYLVNMTTDSLVYSGQDDFNSVVKLDTDRYVTIVTDNIVNLMYKIDLSGFTGGQSGTSYFAPYVDLGSTADDDRMCDVIPLDRQHLIYFYRPENQGSIYALFLKIIDENYAFTSDNSQGGDVTNGQGILVCNIVNNDTAISDYHSGRLINQLSGTTFWVQTDTNEFTFLTMSAS